MNISGLTPRQQDVFLKLVLGKKNQEIGTDLGIDVKTVKSHITLIYKVTGCTHDRELISRFYRELTEVQT